MSGQPLRDDRPARRAAPATGAGSAASAPRAFSPRFPGRSPPGTFAPFGRQRRELLELAARERLSRARVARAEARFARARHAFLGNPVNLLLPFTAGALAGALALFRKPPRPDGRDRGRREGVSLRSLITTAGALWSATATLRESLRAARFEPPPPPAEPSEPAAGMPPPHMVDRATSERQRAPLAARSAPPS